MYFTTNPQQYSNKNKTVPWKTIFPKLEILYSNEWDSAHIPWMQPGSVLLSLKSDIKAMHVHTRTLHGGSITYMLSLGGVFWFVMLTYKCHCVIKKEFVSSLMTWMPLGRWQKHLNQDWKRTSDSKRLWFDDGVCGGLSLTSGHFLNWSPL